jgi:acyl-CoA oxidase
MVLAENDSFIKDHIADFLQLENDLGILEEAIGIFKTRSKTFTSNYQSANTSRN